MKRLMGFSIFTGIISLIVALFLFLYFKPRDIFVISLIIIIIPVSVFGILFFGKYISFFIKPDILSEAIVYDKKWQELLSMKLNEGLLKNIEALRNSLFNEVSKNYKTMKMKYLVEYIKELYAYIELKTNDGKNQSELEEILSLESRDLKTCFESDLDLISSLENIRGRRNK